MAQYRNVKEFLDKINDKVAMRKEIKKLKAEIRELKKGVNAVEE